MKISQKFFLDDGCQIILYNLETDKTTNFFFK